MSPGLVNFLQWASGLLALALLYSLRAGIKGGYWLQTGESLKTAVEALRRDFERAGAKMSDFASELQGLPERLRRDSDDRYMSKQLSEERWTEERRIRSELEDRVREIELNVARRTRVRGD